MKFLRHLPLFLSLLLVPSCRSVLGGEDPELAARYEIQRVATEASETELADIQRRIRKLRMANPAPELEAVSTQLTAVTEEKDFLENEINELHKAIEQAKADLKIYREKYPIRPR